VIQEFPKVTFQSLFLFQLILISFFDGLFDSIKNIFVIFYLDREMNKKSTENAGGSEASKKSSKEKK
jgi:hypothetical protein